MWGNMISIYRQLTSSGNNNPTEHQQAVRAGVAGALVGGMIGLVSSEGKNKIRNALIGAGVGAGVGYGGRRIMQKTRPTDPRYGSSIIAYIDRHNSDEVVEYDKRQKGFYDKAGKPKKQIVDPRHTEDRERGRKSGSKIGEYSWGESADPHLEEVGGAGLIQEIKERYRKAVKDRKLPSYLTMQNPWKHRNTKFPVYSAPWTEGMAQGLEFSFRSPIPIRVMMHPQAKNKGDKPWLGIGSWESFKNRIRFIGPRDRKYLGLSLNDEEMLRQMSYESVKAHELGHLATGLGGLSRFQRSKYQFDSDAEFLTAVRNGMVAARYDTGHKLSRTKDVARLLDELAENPELLSRFNDLPDGGRVFRSYVDTAKEDPELAKVFKKAISVYGSRITSTGSGIDARGTPSFGSGIVDEPYRDRIPFSFGQPDYSNVS